MFAAGTEEGWAQPQTLIVETSSGNMALGLALVCNLSGSKLTIVSDYSCDGFLRRRLEDLGTRVEIVAGSAARGGYQQARLDKLGEICSESPDHFWINQYDNPANPGAYGFFAAQLIESLGQIDCLVASIGWADRLRNFYLLARAVSRNANDWCGYVRKRLVWAARPGA